MEPINFYLGLHINQDQGLRTIMFFQPAYIEKILKTFHFDQANPINISIRKFAMLTLREGRETLPSKKNTKE